MKTFTISFVIFFTVCLGLGQNGGILPTDYFKYSSPQAEDGYLLIKSTYQDWEKGNWVTRQRTLYNHDSNGNCTEQLGQLLKDGIWEDYFIFTYSYDDDGYRTVELVQGWGYYMIFYNYEGKVVKEVQYGWDNNQWQISSEVNHSYFEDINVREEMSKLWIEENWINDYKRTYSYDEYGNDIEWLYKNWVDSNWENQLIATFSYDVNDNNIEELWLLWSEDQWVNYQKWLYSYNTDGEKIDGILQLGEGDGWLNFRKEIYSYDENGNNIELLIQSWDENNWVTKNRYLYIWESVTSLNEQKMILSDFKLCQNYPNPFNPSTTIEFDLPIASDVMIDVYNTAGQKVQTLMNKRMTAGNYEIEFNAANLSSGVYFYRIQAGEFQDMKKMILIK